MVDKKGYSMTLKQEAEQIIKNAQDATWQQYLDATRIPLKDLALSVPMGAQEAGQ